MKKYFKTQAQINTEKQTRISSYIESDIESPKTVGQPMLVVVPFQKNENGKYRAIDPVANWKGWIEYTSEDKSAEISEPSLEELKRGEFNEKLLELERKVRFVSLGILEDSDVNSLRLEVKQLATELGVI